MVRQNMLMRPFFKSGNFLPGGISIFPIFQPFINPFNLFKGSHITWVFLRDLKECLECTIQKTTFAVVFAEIEKRADFDLFINVGT